MKVTSPQDAPKAFKNLDLCLTHALYLEATGEYLERGGRSRWSFAVMSLQGQKLCKELGDDWGFSLNEGHAFVGKRILGVYLDEDFSVRNQRVDIRPVPGEDHWFVDVWNKYMRDE